MKIVNWNINNPTEKLAQNQVDFLLRENADALILTEAKKLPGSLYLQERLQQNGYTVYFDEPQKGYGVLCAMKGTESTNQKSHIDFLPARYQIVRSQVNDTELTIIGLHVPSRGSAAFKNINKIKFQEQTMRILEHYNRENLNKSIIIGGDLNIVEPLHDPHYKSFGEWEYEFYHAFFTNGFMDAFRYLKPFTHKEYSWYGKKGNGYRFDHFFVSKDLEDNITDVYYEQSPRKHGLSDHAAMVLKLDIPGT